MEYFDRIAEIAKTVAVHDTQLQHFHEWEQRQNGSLQRLADEQMRLREAIEEKLEIRLQRIEDKLDKRLDAFEAQLDKRKSERASNLRWKIGTALGVLTGVGSFLEKWK